MGRWKCLYGNVRFIVSLLIVLLIAQDFATLPVAAADPTVSPSPVSLDTIRPGHHQEEEAYLHSRRADANGQVDGQARQDALRQASKLPERATLPAALTGKRPTVGRNAAPPRASWTQLGPAPENTDQLNPLKDYQYGNKVSGRAMAVVVGPHTGVIYLGTAGGGVWKSLDDGVTWNSLTDDQDSLAIGALALDPSDTTDRTLYVGAGEPDYALDSYQGIGVLKTTDGGATWQPFGGNTFGSYSANSTGVAAIVIVGSTVYAATLKGLFSSTNGGPLCRRASRIASRTSRRTERASMWSRASYIMETRRRASINPTAAVAGRR